MADCSNLVPGHTYHSYANEPIQGVYFDNTSELKFIGKIQGRDTYVFQLNSGALHGRIFNFDSVEVMSLHLL